MFSPLKHVKRFFYDNLSIETYLGLLFSLFSFFESSHIPEILRKQPKNCPTTLKNHFFFGPHFLCNLIITLPYPQTSVRCPQLH
ncbi:hypothetical protein HanIR_Chr03g0137531 [Helianthus annuus]|nr:hypothetical protein HanIR_Chr03g0137531 [Helianthus annuus]